MKQHCLFTELFVVVFVYCPCLRFSYLSIMHGMLFTILLFVVVVYYFRP